MGGKSSRNYEEERRTQERNHEAAERQMRMQHDFALRQQQEQQKIKEIEANNSRRQMEHEQQLKQLELRKQEEERAWNKKVMEMKFEDEKRQREDKEKLEKLKFENEQKKRQYEADLRKNEIIRLENRLKDYENLIPGIQTSIQNDTKELNELKLSREKLSISIQSAQEKVESMDINEKLKEKRFELEETKSQYDLSHQKVRDTINKTGVSGENAGTFLRLVHELIPITLDNTDASHQLESYIDTIREVLHRRCQDRYSIKEYFESINLDEYVEVFHNIGAINLENIQFDEEEYKQEIEPVILKFSPDIKIATKRKLKNCCIKCEWKTKEQEMKYGNHQILLECAPVMSLFFDHLYESMKDANELLSLRSNPDLIKKQVTKFPPKKTIEYNEKSDAQFSNLDNSANSKDSEEKVPENDDNKTNSNDLSILLPVSQLNSEATTQNKAIEEVAFDSLSTIPKDIIQNIFNDSNKILQISIQNLHVVQHMDKEFEQNSDVRAIKPFAKGIQDTCLKILKSRVLLRDSMLLIQEILKYKPANLDSDKEVLWKAIDNSCNQIIQTTLEMIKISTIFFGFFLKFQSSFNVYISFVNNNPEVSFDVSLRELRKDLKEFTEFHKQYAKSVQAITGDAFKCLADVITSMKGYKEFETAKNNEERYWNEYIDKLNKYREAEKIFYEKLDEEKKIYNKLKGEKIAIDLNINSAQNSININQNHLKFIKDQCAEIQKNLNVFKSI